MPESAPTAQRHASGTASTRASDPPSRPVLRRLLDRLGIPVRRARASLWFHGASHETDGDLFRAVLEGRADVALVLTANDQASADVLHWKHPGDVVAAMPLATGVARFVERLRPCALVLRDGAELPAAAMARIRDAGVPFVDLRGAPIDAPTVASLVERLPPASVRPSEGPVSSLVPTVRERVGESAAWRAVAPIFMRRRIDDWGTLRERLGHPRTILCLGNGPSSEEPKLASVAHDCLIRVNWRWRERGFLDRPDVVFVGDPRTFRRVPRCIYGLWSVRHEHAMLLRRLVACGPAPMTYFTAERLSPLCAESRWPSRPTNGALAIVAAAALASERIVLGGFDLFAHPAGRYPGDARMRNDYHSVHSVDTELELIALALASFRGEVAILSDNLRRRLDERRERVAHVA